MSTALPILAFVAFIVVVVIAKSVRIVQEYERGVIFRLGRCVGAKGPGIFFIVPLIDKIVRVNLQTMAVPVQPSRSLPKTTSPPRLTRLPTSKSLTRWLRSSK